MSDLVYLDLSSNTGWCRGEPGETPRFGSHLVAQPNTGLGQFLDLFEKWFDKEVIRASFLPRMIVFEAPFLPSTTQLITMRKLLGLAGSVERLCWEWEIPCFEASNQDVCQWFTGKPRWTAPKQKTKAQQRAANRALKKAMTIQACRAIGLDPQDDDAADAIAGWQYACHMKGFKARRWDGPLLGETQPCR